MNKNVYANQVHTRLRYSTYTPQRAIILVKTTNFVQKPKRKPIMVIWRKMERPSLERMETINGSVYHKIDIGAGMQHWVKSA